MKSILFTHRKLNLKSSRSTYLDIAHKNHPIIDKLINKH